MQDGGTDIKTCYFVFEVLANFVPDSQEVAEKVIRETCLLSSFSHLLELSTHWHTDVLECIFRILDTLFEVKLEY